jgi:DNA polymerase III subunit alpha, Gram-positive type
LVYGKGWPKDEPRTTILKMIPFSDIDFVIFDVETTGLSPANGDRMIELGALKVRGTQVIDRFYSLIDPQRPLSYGAFLVNGISTEMLEGAPVAAEVLPKFLRFLGGAVLVGHNVNFDLGFLNAELERSELAWRQGYSVLDTRRLARWLLPDLRSYRLQNVSYALAIEDFQQHRAMSDVEMTRQVFAQFLEMAFRRDVATLKQLLRHGGVKFSGRVFDKIFESAHEE